MSKPHVWRYDATMPAEERPWIVSVEGQDAECFQTWEDAVEFAFTGEAGK